MVQTHDLGTLIHSRWILSHLCISQTKVTENPTKTKTQRNVPKTQRNFPKVIRVKRWWSPDKNSKKKKKLQIPKALHPTTQPGSSPYPQPTQPFLPEAPTLLHPPGSRLRDIQAEFHRPHRSLPTLQDTPARPRKRPYQVGVGGPLQSCWWSLPWAPRSPARSLRSRTTWRVPEWPARVGA